LSSARRRRGAAAGALALTVLLSGCSVLQIRTEAKDSGPVKVGVHKTAGQEPTEKPTDAGLPDGMTKKTVNLGKECPVEVTFALGDDWNDGAGDSDRFRVFSRGTDSRDSDVLIVNCSEDFGGSAQAIIDSKQKYTFDEAGSQLLSETSGSLKAGVYWSYQGELGESEILAINGEPTLMYGVDAGVKINGRLVNLSVEMRTLKTKTEAAEDFEKMLPTVTIDGQRVPAPSFR
jgi:hypothetical protein